jgi:pimeloyl-ACP methyl ester carboxylesterase
MWFRTAALLGALAAVASCSGAQESRQSQTAIEWGPCPDYPDFRGVNAECTSIPVPLDHAHPGRTISIFVARVRGSAPEASKRGQLWFLTGGPGSSVVGFAPWAQRFAALRPEWDFYMFEQRGVANSALLSCAAANSAEGLTPANAPDCLAELDRTWPEGIQNFSVTNTALDLAQIIDQLRVPGRKVAVYGVSYGTYLLQRYLALRPEQPDAVIFDSIAAQGFAEYDTYERFSNEAARMVMDRCGRDPACAGRLSGIASDPWSALGVTFDRLEQGRLCPALQARLDSPLTPDDLRYLFGVMVVQVELRGLMPAVVLRLNRCLPEDVDALELMMEALLGKQPRSPAVMAGPAFVPYDQVKYSAPLYYEIVLSELWKGTPLAQLEKEQESYYASRGVILPVAALADAHVWPVYSDPLSARHAATDRPVLMLNSDIDPQTPLELAMHLRDDLHGPNQYFVTMPGGGHIVIFNSLLNGGNSEDPTGHCGSLVMLSFLDDPTRPPDTSCISNVEPLSFDASDPRNQQTSQQYFGIPTMW